MSSPPRTRRSSNELVPAGSCLSRQKKYKPLHDEGEPCETSLKQGSTSDISSDEEEEGKENAVVHFNVSADTEIGYNPPRTITGGQSSSSNFINRSYSSAVGVESFISSGSDESKREQSFSERSAAGPDDGDGQGTLTYLRTYTKNQEAARVKREQQQGNVLGTDRNPSSLPYSQLSTVECSTQLRNISGGNGKETGSIAHGEVDGRGGKRA